MSEANANAILSAISALTPVVIGGLGLCFTNVYKVQEAESNRINAERLALERQLKIRA